MNSKFIEGVIIKKIKTHSDRRGFFREIIKSNIDFSRKNIGQISHSLVYKGVIKAWHGHKLQSQWNYVVTGKAKIALYDARKKSSTYGQTMEFIIEGSNKPKAYFFPPGVFQGYKCLKGPMHIVYVTSGIYDPIADETRIAKEKIKYKW